MNVMVALDLDSRFLTLFMSSYPLRIKLDIIKKIIESVSHLMDLHGNIPHIYNFISHSTTAPLHWSLSFVTQHRVNFGSDILTLVFSLA